ncbi:MAG TPA: response regulator transcription factor [Symbiobacteriaceae bacterium]|jgi:two-component system KDP operon response regulator KdpE
MLLESDSAFRDFLTLTLRAREYAVEGIGSAEAALQSEALRQADVILLGLGQWGQHERAVLDSVRKQGGAPVVVMAPRTSEMDRRMIMQAGADDYIAKPVGIAELLARIQALLYHPHRGGDGVVVISGNLVIDTARRMVTIDGADVDLTEAEYYLLKTMALNHGQSLAPSELCRLALGRGYRLGLDNLPLLIESLRHKLEIVHHQPRWIHTERGIGYRFQQLSPDAGAQAEQQQ